MAMRVYSKLMDPTVYPDYGRREYRVPTWELFDHVPQCTALRAFTIRDNQLVNFREDLDLYERLNLGRVIWPVFYTLFARNFNELVEEIKKRGLFLFDIWGHIPGSSYEGMWSHVMPPKGMVEHLQQELGDRFLGIDNGEQDGRYVCSYANQQCPSPADRYEQYLNFQRHFQRMGDDLGNKLSTLVSLCFGHYFLKEGNHILIGAETGQALPSSQVYYAFIRGAGKQYGVHWFGNASIFNRWGYKSYESDGEVGGVNCGPTQGTSLNLLRRLIYTHYLYNCVAIGFEQAWLMGDNVEKRLNGLPVPMEEDRSTAVLSPVGEIQVAAHEFVQKQGQPGVMQTPIALMLDHYSGWAMPRHLYTSNVYQVWGAMPYEAGDYFTHNLLSMIYPGYEDASYYRDERGFLASTPYGDSADVILSDAPDWIMKQYNVIVAAGKLKVDAEVRAKFDAFVEQGGHLVVTADNARELWPDLKIEHPTQKPTGTTAVWSDGSKTNEKYKIPACPATLPAGASVLAKCKDMPLVVRIAKGKGQITLLLTPFGLNERPTVTGPIVNAVEKPLVNPYPLLGHVQKVLHEVFSSQRLFSVGQGLGYIVCRKGAGEYTLGVFNPDLFLRPFKIVSHCGKIQKITELAIDQQAKTRVGYWPAGMEKHNAGESSQATISGGDIRLFSVSVKEEDVQAITPSKPSAPVKDRILSIKPGKGIKETILAMPTFFQHFDGVKIDWEYLRDRDRSRIEYERGWLGRQKARIIVDFSHGLNFYPDLTLLDTLMFRYEQSVAAIDDVLDKMKLIGSAEAVISLHRKPENHCDDARAADRFLAGVRDLCKRAAQRDIVLYVQTHSHKWYASTREMVEFVDKVGAANLKLAINTGHVMMSGEKIKDAVAAVGDRLGLVLLSSSGSDNFGQTYDTHAPIHGGQVDLAAIKKTTVPRVFDADYRSWDEIFADIQLI